MTEQREGSALASSGQGASGGLENAIAFLNHPSIKNSKSYTEEEKKQFLRNKNVSEAEIEKAFRRTASSNDDDGLKPIVLPNNPPVLPYGMIQKQNSSSLRWTQVVAYAAALAVLGWRVYPRVMKSSLFTTTESNKKKEEEEKKKKQTQMLDAISKSLSENLADLEKKLRERQETTESAVLASVKNVEEKMREELQKAKMTQREDVMEERERAEEKMRETKKKLMETVEEERKEAKKEMDALRRSVLREMELAREDFAKTTKREEEEASSPSRRLGEKGYVAERVEAVESTNNYHRFSSDKNNEDLDLDDYFQAKKRHQMELLGGGDDDDDINSMKSQQQQQQQQQQQRAANVRKNMGSNHNQPQQQRVLEEPPRPKNFLEVIELVEKGEPVPGIKDIDDRPPNPDVALPPVSEDFEERTKKPWSMKPSDDESFEGHRPWDKYGDGAAASGEYSFDGGGGGGGWTPPSVPQMSDSARQAYGL
ncbi:unnamed protein product [Bathycoccus prasinos]